MIQKGTYILFLSFHTGIETKVGSLGSVKLLAGDYCYVGSAKSGLDQRLSRHFSHKKTVHWHIDYLTVLCKNMAAYETEDQNITECDLAKFVIKKGGIPAVVGFGCSDCNCKTHLFSTNREALESNLKHIGMHTFNDKKECKTIFPINLT